MLGKEFPQTHVELHERNYVCAILLIWLNSLERWFQYLWLDRYTAGCHKNHINANYKYHIMNKNSFCVWLIADLIQLITLPDASNDVFCGLITYELSPGQRFEYIFKPLPRLPSVEVQKWSVPIYTVWHTVTNSTFVFLLHKPPAQVLNGNGGDISLFESIPNQFFSSDMTWRTLLLLTGICDSMLQYLCGCLFFC